MLILPVLDLKRGQAVHGRRGKRETYQPVRSRLCASSNPVDLARAFREQLGLNEIYLADLDAIGGEPPAIGLLQQLADEGFRCWVDPGVRSRHDAACLHAAASIYQLVVGLETVQSPDEVAAIVNVFGPDRICFSLDMMEGVPLAGAARWREASVLRIVKETIAFGIRRYLLLDLARVGADGGVGTESLAAEIRRLSRRIDVYVGGGVRGRQDLSDLRSLGIRGVLMASALHDGRIGRDDVHWLSHEARLY